VGRARSGGQQSCGPVVLIDLQGKGPCGKRSIFAVLIFWLLFYQEKSNSPFRRRMSRADVHLAQTSPMKVESKISLC
jgi:hypothetical protein